MITDCPVNIETNIDTGECSATNIDITLPVAQDNCGVSSFVAQINDSNGNIITFNTIESIRTFAFPLGETVITWMVTDNRGNTSTVECQQTITVIDNIPPIFTSFVSDVTVECDEVPEREDLTASDNCGDAVVTFEEIRRDGNCPSNYTLERTWTATDAANLTTSFTQTITVQDTTAPEFVGNLPQDITVECDAIPEPETLNAFDNCGIATVSVNDANTPGDCLGSFTILRTWTATDACNLTTTHTQIINVIDTTAPIPTQAIQDNITVSCTDIPDAPEVEFTDNCSSDIIVVFNEVNEFDDTVFEDYLIRRTWTVRDACSNEAVFTQTLNVTLDEFVTTIDDRFDTRRDGTPGGPRCFNDGVIDLNTEFLDSDVVGVWEIVEGDRQATLRGNIFDPTTLVLDDDFKPGSEPKNYLLRHTALRDGCINVTEVIIDINAECIVLPCGDTDVVISKAITPNGDGNNDRFDIMGIELCGFIANVKIFNRWGALIFESNNYALGEGQGTFQGNSPSSSFGNSGTVPNGTYYYIINLENSGLAPFTGPIYIGTK